MALEQREEPADDKRGALSDGDAFLMEAWHIGENPIPFTLTVLADSSNGGGLFQEAILVMPCYNRISVPIRIIDILPMKNAAGRVRFS